MTKLTIKQENFVLAYIETGNASEAYRQAYDADRMKPETINRKAFELLDNGKITARLDAVQAEHRDRHDVTVDSICAELETARKQALKADQNSAAIAASMGKAKMHGLFSERHIHVDERPLKNESREEIEARILLRVERLKLRTVN